MASQSTGVLMAVVRDAGQHAIEFIDGASSGGRDTLIGGSGDDVLEGQGGDDRLIGDFSVMYDGSSSVLDIVPFKDGYLTAFQRGTDDYVVHFDLDLNNLGNWQGLSTTRSPSDHRMGEYRRGVFRNLYQAIRNFTASTGAPVEWTLATGR